MKNAKSAVGRAAAPAAPEPPPASSPLPDDPAEKPYPGYARELAAQTARLDAGRRASAVPLPGPLAEAFAGDPTTIHGYTLQPVTASLLAVLTRLDSPLLRINALLVGAGEKTPDELRALTHSVKIEPEQVVELVFCFLTPASELRRLLAAGRDKFRDHAMRALGDQAHPIILADLERACGLHYGRSFLTVINYEPMHPPGEVFSRPPAEATASVGGSTQSAH